MQFIMKGSFYCLCIRHCLDLFFLAMSSLIDLIFGFSIALKNSEVIYPSQRQNLLLTLEIITHNFQNFLKIQNFGKKIPKPRIFFQNFQNHKGAANEIKGAAASLLVNSKISIFN